MSVTSTETLPSPFEWDVKRLAASLAVAGRDNGFAGKDRRKIILAGVESYRTAMRAFAEQPFLAVWYAHLDVEDAIAQFQSQMSKKTLKATQKMVAKARTHDSTQALSKLATQVDGQWRIISDPPVIEPIEEVFPDAQASAIYELLRETLGKYRRTLQSDRKHLLEQFTLVQVAGCGQDGIAHGPGHWHWSSRVSPVRAQIVAAEMLVAELGDHFISVRRVAQHGCDANRLVLPETAGVASVA